MAKTRQKPKDNPLAALRRLLAVARLLRRNEPFDSTIAGAGLGVCAKSIKRHIHVLRRHGWEIDFDYRERTYVLRSAPRPSLF